MACFCSWEIIIVFDVDVPHVDADEHSHADTERGPSETTKIIKIQLPPKTTFHENVVPPTSIHQKVLPSERMKIVEMDKVKKKTGWSSVKKSRAA
jgi:hypothetical protein